MVDSYKDLEVWKIALEQCVDIYEVTKGFPKEEMYGLISQLRRGTVSVVSNIAEGFVRKHSREFIETCISRFHGHPLPNPLPSRERGG